MGGVLIMKHDGTAPLKSTAIVEIDPGWSWKLIWQSAAGLLLSCPQLTVFVFPVVEEDETMRSIFLKLSATALAGLTLAFGSMSASLAALSTPAPTTAATAAAPAAAATTQPTAQSAAATVATSQYPACPNPNATAVATAASTAATSAATTAATAPVNPTPGYLGIAAQQVQNCGAQILDVRPGSAAETAKLQIGDVVVAVDGQAITSLDQFRMIIQNHKPNDKITITYQRGGQQADTTATLGAVPADTTATQAATAASK